MLDQLDPITRRAVQTAVDRVELALHIGRLLTPGEALALAGGEESRRYETLYSIARKVAAQTQCDAEAIRACLVAHFPRYDLTGETAPPTLIPE